MEWQLDDNVNIHDVVVEVEREFGINISESECLEIQTVGDLLNCVVKHTKSAGPDLKGDRIVQESEMWERLRKLLVKELGVDPDEVVKIRTVLSRS